VEDDGLVVVVAAFLASPDVHSAIEYKGEFVSEVGSKQNRDCKVFVFGVIAETEGCRK